MGLDCIHGSWECKMCWKIGKLVGFSDWRKREVEYKKDLTDYIDWSLCAGIPNSIMSYLIFTAVLQYGVLPDKKVNWSSERLNYLSRITIAWAWKTFLDLHLKSIIFFVPTFSLGLEWQDIMVGAYMQHFLCAKTCTEHLTSIHLLFRISHWGGYTCYHVQIRNSA